MKYLAINQTTVDEITIEAKFNNANGDKLLGIIPYGNILRNEKFGFRVFLGASYYNSIINNTRIDMTETC